MDAATKITRLYGEASVNYGNTSIKAGYIELNYVSNLIHATGTKDSTGKITGAPIFQEGSENYNADEMKYNFKTKKAVIKGVVTKQGEGFVQGQQVKKDPENNLYIRDAIYTTCDLKHPHFHISAKKIKLVHDKQVVTGPFNLVIADIPTPLGFPFGVFPMTKHKPNGTSGIIVPTYGEEPNGRGFFLSQGGYYLALSQYVGLTLLGEIYTRGDWGLSAQSTYKKRYRYDGSFNLRFNVNHFENATDGSVSSNQAFWIDWSHRPVQRGLSSFSASVNAGSTKYNNRNSYDVNQYLAGQFQSSISYSTAFRGTPFRAAINLRESQSTQTGQVDLTFPSLSLNMNRIYPFKTQNSTGKGWWETISFGFDFSGSVQLSNKVRSEGAFPFVVYKAVGEKKDSTLLPINSANFGELWKRAQIGGNYAIPISATLKLFRYFSLNPSISLQGYVYPYKMNYIYHPDTRSVKVDTVPGFSNAYNFSTSVSFNTRVYGTFNLNGKTIQSIRHTLIPSISLGYSPDFSDPSFGFYQWVPVTGAHQGIYTQRPPDVVIKDYRLLSRYQGFMNGGPSGAQSGNIGFSLNNTLDAKMRTKGDTTGKKFEKVPLLNSLGLNTSYNLLADSLNLSPISLSTNTTILKSFSVSASATVDPYHYQADRIVTSNQVGTQTKFYAWQRGEGLGQISNANISLSKSFKPGGVKKTDDAQKKRIEDADAPVEDKAKILANPNLYVDFNIPWTLNVSYSFNYSKQGLSKKSVSQALSFNGDVSLTPKWKIGFSSGYDFERKGISYTSVNINRDLHCWQMSLQWAPFGGRPYYSFTLNVKSSLLRDLKLTKQNTFVNSNPYLGQ
ncbi:MAG: putative LPS assembly protein LptD [Bacteroidota bacterium]